MNHERRRGFRYEFLFLVAVTIGGFVFNYAALYTHYEDTHVRLERLETRVDQMMVLLAQHKEVQK